MTNMTNKLATKLLLTTKSTLVLLLALMLAGAGLFSGLLTANAQVAQMHAHDSEWDVSGDYVWQLNYQGTDYAHNVNLAQDENFEVTGEGESSPYEWEITSGGVTNDSIDLDAEYTATSDATDPLTTMEINGTIAEDGTISGTWSDNYQGAEREGTFRTSSGAAVLIEDEDDDNGNEGELEGEVEGGTGTGELEVTSIEVVDSTGVADGTFENGWEYVFNITVPTDEEDLSMKFKDWLRDGGGDTIPVAGNMRISSDQADNDGDYVVLTAENTYSSPKLHMTEDMDPEEDGMQVEVRVEVAIPEDTQNGSYTTTYGVRTE